MIVYNRMEVPRVENWVNGGEYIWMGSSIKSLRGQVAKILMGSHKRWEEEEAAHEVDSLTCRDLPWDGSSHSSQSPGKVTSSCWWQSLFRTSCGKTLKSPFSTYSNTWASFKEKLGCNGRSPLDGSCSCRSRVWFSVGDRTTLAPRHGKPISTLPTMLVQSTWTFRHAENMWEKKLPYFPSNLVLVKIQIRDIHMPY